MTNSITRTERVAPGYYRAHTTLGVFEISRVVYPHNGRVWWNLIDPTGNAADPFYTKAEAKDAVLEIISDPDSYGL